eukprot:IDg15947t1
MCTQAGGGADREKPWEWSRQASVGPGALPYGAPCAGMHNARRTRRARVCGAEHNGGTRDGTCAISSRQDARACTDIKHAGTRRPRGARAWMHTAQNDGRAHARSARLCSPRRKLAIICARARSTCATPERACAAARCARVMHAPARAR